MSEFTKEDQPSQSRRNLLKFGAFASLAIATGTFAVPKEAEAAAAFPVNAEAAAFLEIKVDDLDHQPAMGSQPAFWIPSKGHRLPVNNPGNLPFIREAFDKFDQVDKIANGDMARSVYWKSTSQWIAETNQYALIATNEASYVGNCEWAATGEYFAPKIHGPINVLGIEFAEIHRQVVRTYAFAGIRRTHHFPKMDADAVSLCSSFVKDQGACVIVNYGDRTAKWWGLLRDVDQYGRFVVTKTIDFHENIANLEAATLSVYPSTLTEAAVLLDPEQRREDSGGAAAFNFLYTEGELPIKGRTVAEAILGMKNLSFA